MSPSDLVVLQRREQSSRVARGNGCARITLRHTSRAPERFAAHSENKNAAYLYAAFSFFLVEPWGIEPQTSRVRF